MGKRHQMDNPIFKSRPTPQEVAAYRQAGLLRVLVERYPKWAEEKGYIEAVEKPGFFSRLFGKKEKSSGPSVETLRREMRERASQDLEIQRTRERALMRQAREEGERQRLEMEQQAAEERRAAREEADERKKRPPRSGMKASRKRVSVEGGDAEGNAASPNEAGAVVSDKVSGEDVAEAASSPVVNASEDIADEVAAEADAAPESQPVGDAVTPGKSSGKKATKKKATKKKATKKSANTAGGSKSKTPEKPDYVKTVADLGVKEGKQSKVIIVRVHETTNGKEYEPLLVFSRPSAGSYFTREEDDYYGFALAMLNDQQGLTVKPLPGETFTAYPSVEAAIGPVDDSESKRRDRNNRVAKARARITDQNGTVDTEILLVAPSAVQGYYSMFEPVVVSMAKYVDEGKLRFDPGEYIDGDDFYDKDKLAEAAEKAAKKAGKKTASKKKATKKAAKKTASKKKAAKKSTSSSSATVADVLRPDDRDKLLSDLEELERKEQKPQAERPKGIVTQGKMKKELGFDPRDAIPPAAKMPKTIHGIAEGTDGFIVGRRSDVEKWASNDPVAEGRVFLIASDGSSVPLSRGEPSEGTAPRQRGRRRGRTVAPRGTN